MKRPFTLALLTLAFLASLSGLATAQTVLKPVAVIRDDVVRLGDLFDGLGEKAETAVARAPAPGTEVELDARWLAALARTYDLTWRPDSRFTTLVVSRPAQVIGGERIGEEILDSILRERPDLDISLELDNPGFKLVLPEGEDGSIAVRNLSFDVERGRFRAEVVAPAEGRVLAQSVVAGRLEQMVEVPVLQRPVAPGEVVKANDLGWQRVRAERVGRGIVREAEAIVGKSPRRPISIDQPVRTTDLRAPIAVAKNSLVVISLNTERMSLTVQGRALENGAAGDVIRVANTKSNTVVNAVVVREGLVEVPFLSTAAVN